MNNMFRGFTNVFGFNFRNHTQSPKYRVVTVVFALFLMLGFGIMMMVLGSPEDEVEETGKEITKVYVCNENDLNIPAYAEFAEMAGDNETADIEFEKMEGTVSECMDTLSKESDYILAVQTKNEDGYLIQLILGPLADYDDESLDSLGMSMANYYKGYLYQMTGLKEETLLQVILPVVSTVTEFTEEEDEGREIFRIISAFAIVMVVYFIVMIYGMQICSDVSLEKTSKLTEQLLISVTPYALVSGKIMAVIASSMIQFVIWVCAIIVGLFGGDRLAISLYDLDGSVLTEAWGLLKKWFEGSDFGIPAIVLGVISCLIGIALFLILSGVGGSCVGKPEEAANMQGIYMIPMMICYFIVIFGLVEHEGYMPLPYYLIPFTGAFLTPGALISGGISIAMGILSIVISIVCCIILMVIAAKIYKGMMFFNNTKAKPKDIIQFIFSK